MQDFVQLLHQLQPRLVRLRGERLRETPTRAVFIDPVLEALGWDTRDPAEVELEYPTVDRKYVDYALKLNGKPVMFVEAKALSDPLTDVKAVTQVIGYAANAGVTWCVLTNGVRWRVYRSTQTCLAPDKLVFEVSLDPQDNNGLPIPRIAEQMWQLSREEVAKGALSSASAKAFVDRRVGRTLAQLMRDPPPTLLGCIRDAVGDEELKPAQIKESLARIWPDVDVEKSPTVRALKAGDSRRSRHPPDRRNRPRPDGQAESRSPGAPRRLAELYRAADRLCFGMTPRATKKRQSESVTTYSHGTREVCSIRLKRKAVSISLNLGTTRKAKLHRRDKRTHKLHPDGGVLVLSIHNQKQLSVAAPLIQQTFRLRGTPEND